MLPDYESKQSKPKALSSFSLQMPSLRSPIVWLVALLLLVSLLSFFLIGRISDIHDVQQSRPRKSNQNTDENGADKGSDSDRTNDATITEPAHPHGEQQPRKPQPAIHEHDHDTDLLGAGGQRSRERTATFVHTEKTLDDEKLYTVKIPNVQSYDSPDEDPEVKRKRLAVRSMFEHAYGGYERRCLGKGEVRPISGQCHDWLVHNMGLTIMDSLDTMLIMGLNDMYIRGRDFLKRNLNFDADIQVSVFETNIRCLGGLLAAYDYTKDKFLLDQAEDLARRLQPAFETNSGLPRGVVNLRNRRTGSISWAGGSSVLAEVGTTQLEWTYLAAATNNSAYARTVLRTYEALRKVQPADRLFPVFVNPESGHFTTGQVTIGALADSFYEYIVKYWLATGKTETQIGKWYFEIAENILKILGTPIANSDQYVLYERNGGLINKWDHLACFAGAMFAIGAVNSDDDALRTRHLEAAKGIGSFCHGMYKKTRTGLPYEAVHFDKNAGITSPGHSSRYYLQRPEAIETWFYLWRLTKDPKYREWGWEFYQAIEQHTRREHGYTGLRDADDPNSVDDVQQSFFLAETLKYLYLLFCPDDVIPLDKFVFTTEAHPLSHYRAMYAPTGFD